MHGREECKRSERRERLKVGEFTLKIGECPIKGDTVLIQKGGVCASLIEDNAANARARPSLWSTHGCG